MAGFDRSRERRACIYTVKAQVPVTKNIEVTLGENTSSVPI